MCARRAGGAKRAEASGSVKNDDAASERAGDRERGGTGTGGEHEAEKDKKLAPSGRFFGGASHIASSLHRPFPVATDLPVQVPYRIHPSTCSIDGAVSYRKGRSVTFGRPPEP